ncbi:hypothetical protein BJ508DRAFT_337036 [Ascobolus immersus RN42]|uniref:Uncharacterized protein n=1 Tax=Ascobolus immersus RN42 TaxID=1160509 RepID=A0A3N4H6N0_ASCIM|nr:hypothetical protein BJ508DRAFT_337036 [Ascobolus immersus RN42]
MGQSQLYDPHPWSLPILVLKPTAPDALQMSCNHLPTPAPPPSPPATTPIKIAPLAIRDAINKALKAANAPGYLLIRSVTVNSKGNALLTLLEGDTNADLVKFSQHVTKALASIGITTTRIEPDNCWFRLFVHRVSVVDFGKEEGMEYLCDEINRFN